MAGALSAGTEKESGETARGYGQYLFDHHGIFDARNHLHRPVAVPAGFDAFPDIHPLFINVAAIEANADDV